MQQWKIQIKIELYLIVDDRIKKKMFFAAVRDAKWMRNKLEKEQQKKKN